MKILKLLNKIFFIVLFTYAFLFSQVIAEDKPIDIWNLEKNENEEIKEKNLSSEIKGENSKTSVFDMQSDKQNNPIDIFSIYLILFSIKLLKNFLIIIPIITGTVTTKNIFNDIPSIETSFSTYVISNKSIDKKTT